MLDVVQLERRKLLQSGLGIWRARQASCSLCYPRWPPEGWFRRRKKAKGRRSKVRTRLYDKCTYISSYRTLISHTPQYRSYALIEFTRSCLSPATTFASDFCYSRVSRDNRLLCAHLYHSRCRRVTRSLPSLSVVSSTLAGAQ